MKKILLILTLSLTAMLYFACQSEHTTESGQTHSKVTDKKEKPPKRTRIKEAFEYDFEITKDPALGYPPTERMSKVMKALKKKTAEIRNKSAANEIEDLSWKERGPNNVAGRTRTILIDKNDPSNKTVFTAGVSGGIWRTRDITVSRPTWENIYENYKKIAITGIAQDPNNPQIMYYCTGESSGVRGLGLWKSVNGGDSWTHLTSTENSDFYYSQRMLVHPVTSDVYVATRSAGLQRSTDAGETWEAAFDTRPDITDIKISSDNKLYLSSGFVSGGGRIYVSETGNPDDWTAITGVVSNFPGTLDRIELALSESDPNVIYALGARGLDAEGIYKTTNGGAFWSEISPPSAIGMEVFTRGQAWYDLCIAVDPNNSDRVIIGGIDLLMSSNGGNSWTQISQWFGGGGLQYVHADQHYILYEPGNSSVIYFSNDGGIWRTNDGGLSNLANIEITNRNNGYNVTQFYACAMHPEKHSDYFLAGSQDNGSQQFDSYEIDNTKEVLGGDGFFCHIDQNEPQYQMVSLYYGAYALSNDGGATFSAGGVSIGPNSGFLNPSDYDDEANILYARGDTLGQYHRWNINNQEKIAVDINNSGSVVRHVSVSPNVSNRIYIGLPSSRYLIIDDAHQGTSKQAQSISITGGQGGTVSCIEIEKGNEDHILVTQTNYGVASVFETKDGGMTWENVEGDLPDMPVRWVVFNPLNADQAFIATEAGVWATDDLNGSETVWMPQINGMQTVRCDMLQVRESDNFILAGTYGRGLFTTDGLAEPFVRINIPQITYTDVPVEFRDYSINPDSWLWNFGDGETSIEKNPEHAYADADLYPVSITIGENLSTTTNIKVLPDKNTPDATGGGDYTGDFEDAANQDFGAYNISGSKFERGKSGQLGKSGTHSGDNAWVIGIDEPFYQKNTEAILYTPNYNLTERGIYEFSFWGKHDINYGFDGFRVEYSTNKGRDWRVLGQEGDNWYNYSNATSIAETAFPSGSHYFTGRSSGNAFQKYKLNISELSGNEVAFRFVFKTIDAGVFPGVAIDDVEIKALKTDGELKTIITDFSGSFENTDLTVVWKTQPEYRNDFFEVEYSLNGRDWQIFANEKIDAVGFSIDEVAYTREYDEQKRPLYYLRVKGTDLDSINYYSEIIVMSRNIEDQGIYRLYPNPFTDHINIAFNDLVRGDVIVEMYDALGQKVAENTIGIPDAYTRIDLGDLPNGTYVVRITIGEETYTEKIQRAK